MLPFNGQKLFMTSMLIRYIPLALSHLLLDLRYLFVQVLRLFLHLFGIALESFDLIVNCGVCGAAQVAFVDVPARDS
jgi:hypothetical protein